MKRYEFDNHENWHDRGYLPHYEADEKLQIITYRLADSLPQKVIQLIASRNEQDSGAPLSAAAQKDILQKRLLVENHLDEGYGSCLLTEPEVAEKVISSWKFFAKKKYDLIAYVVMPSHVHLLIKPYPKQRLGDLVRSWKLFSTNFILSKPALLEKFKASMETGPLGRSKSESVAGKFSIWQREYWDRFIRDERHYHQAIGYIENNPVKAGLVEDATQWPWSSR